MKSLIVSVFLLLMSASALADSALIIRGDGFCNIFDGDGNIVLADAYFGVSTDSTPEFLRVTCKAKGLQNSAKVAVHYDAYNNPFTDLFGFPIPCGWDDGSGQRFSLEWHSTISASGNATFTCLMKNTF